MLIHSFLQRDTSHILQRDISSIKMHPKAKFVHFCVDDSTRETSSYQPCVKIA